MRAAKAKPNPIHPREIFNSLPKPAGINDLYVSQAEVLDAWHGRRDERDVVIKLHTGGGKTLVALLMAQSVINQTGLPILYLAPTNQLVSQVLAKSREYGIAAVPYVSGQPLPAEFEDGKAVLVGAYETLFSGRSKFGVRGPTGNPFGSARLSSTTRTSRSRTSAGRSHSRSGQRSTRTFTRRSLDASARRFETLVDLDRLTT
jgi:hypothetical protein